MISWPVPRIRAVTSVVLPLFGALAILAAASPSTVPATTSPSPTPAATPTIRPNLDVASVPMFAYYYIWFDPSSWNRAKSDLPVLGPYSSDDETVMRQHIQEAKSAGIEGFIVSWKSTTVLDRRLATLIQVAREEDFKLAIIYQGLDFSREPLPATQIADDLDYFISHFASDPVFDSFGKPVVIWSGTWRFSEADIAAVAGPRRDRLQILASEQSVDGFERVADLVDGNAYYWSSVNPDTYPDYPGKLAAMGAAVHDKGGLWISPAAPGFDPRFSGHRTAVDRRGGKMLERQLDASIRSFPDAIGLISWNEFSENSYVEPSRDYGDQSLQVLADLNKTNLTPVSDFDSSAPAGVDPSPGVGRLLAILAVSAIAVVAVGIIARRRRRIARRRRWSSR